jgi:hypothetical protein
MRRLAVLLLCAASSRGAGIVLPASSFERSGTVVATVWLDAPASGKARLRVLWTDVHGRTVEDRRSDVVLAGRQTRFALDLSRARAMKNTLRVEVDTGSRKETAETTFIARPGNTAWWDYVVLMWNGYPAVEVPKLKSLGVNAGQMMGRNAPPPPALVEHDLRWYAENIATDFYAAYHRWFPDKPVNHLFRQAKELYRLNPASKEAFNRSPSLSDPEWIERVRARLAEAARRHSPWGPVFYSLGDESGIADLSAFWDFDFSEHSLKNFRDWLKERYGTLEALNAQWGSKFAAWERIEPDTTNESMSRADLNWSSWSDHKEYMDAEFARALKMGADAVRAVDPRAYVGIGGAQMPGWGGYDYARLTEALTVLEPYNIGNNVEIIRSLRPELAVMTTSFAGGPWEKHRVWYELLHGARGSIIWDDKREFVARDGSIGARGREAGVYFNELRRGVAALLMASERLEDPIAIHYSQSSMRNEWMKQHRPAGTAWTRRNASSERMDSGFLRIRESWCRLIEDLGMQYNFVSYGQMERGELARGGYRVLILPWSSSLSAAESAAIREFAAGGGLVLTDAVPGTHDEHCRRLPRARLEGVVEPLPLDVLNYHQHRLTGKEGPVRDSVGARIAKRVTPEFRLTGEDGGAVTGVEMHRFRNGGARLIGLLSNPQMRVNELGPPDFKSNARFEKPVRVRLAFPSEMQVYDVRGARDLGRLKEWSGAIDPYEPVLLALMDKPAPALRLTSTRRVARGATAHWTASMSGTPASRPVLRVEIADPAGTVAGHYSGNALAPRGRASGGVPFAVNDPPGRWRVTVADVMTGRSQSADVEVY